MTDNTFVAAEPEDGPNRKPLLMAGAAVGVAVLAGAGWFLLHGGSDSSSTDAFVAPHHVVQAKGAPAAVAKSAKAPAKVATLPAASSVKIGRDPFAALYMVPVAPAASGAPATAGSTASTPTSAGTATGTSTGASAPAAPTRYALKLLSVSGTGKAQTAAFSVAGKTQYARVGAVFGRTSEIKLLSFQQVARGVWSVTIQVGDDDPKDIMRGESISVL